MEQGRPVFTDQAGNAAPLLWVSVGFSQLSTWHFQVYFHTCFICSFPYYLNVFLGISVFPHVFSQISGDPSPEVTTLHILFTIIIQLILYARIKKFSDEKNNQKNSRNRKKYKVKYQDRHNIDCPCHGWNSCAFLAFCINWNI